MTQIKQIILTCLLSFGLFMLGCNNLQSLADSIVAPTATSTYSKAVFAGGCFWCMENPFDQLPGVVDTTSGYTGGSKANPSYREVSSGSTGHAEAVQVTYDTQQVQYDTLLKVFWHNIDPLDSKGQFCDKGSQYRSAIFYANEQQKAAAENAKAELSSRFSQPIVTEISQAKTFYPAEDYHQNYYKTHEVKYKFYRFACGRDQRLKEVWGDEAGH